MINILVMGEYRLLLFLAIYPKLKLLWHFVKFMLTQDDTGLEISKYFSPYGFHLISAKLHENIGYHGGMHAVTLLGNRPS